MWLSWREQVEMVKGGGVKFGAALFLAKQDSLQCGGQSIIMLLKYVLGGEGVSKNIFK